MSNLKQYGLPSNAYQWLVDSAFEQGALLVGSSLISAGYSPRTINSYLSCIAHFAFWCSIESVAIEQTNEATLIRFLDEHIPNCRCAPRCRLAVIEHRAALRQLLLGLRKLGTISPIGPVCSDDISAELREFDHYLDEVRGLQPMTRDTRTKYVRQFLSDQFSDGAIRIDALKPADIVDYVSRRSAGWKAATVGVLCNSLRSYFRFKSVQGTSTVRLISSLPKIAQWRLATLPKALSKKELDTLLAAFDRETPGGRRDYAIARCYVDLGLRTAEVVRLQLDDIDWHQGVIFISGKGRRRDTLPLPQRTGEAIARYLQIDRQESATRAIFQRLRPPHNQPAVAATIRGSIRNAARRCGLSARLSGPHILRHTMATRLVQSGVPFKEVSDLLRHRDLDTTTLYAKVDMNALSTVLLPWPGQQA